MQAFYTGIQLAGSLLVMVLVIVATYYASRWYAGKMGGKATSRHIKIIDKMNLGPGCLLAIAQVGEKFYLIGLSDKNIQMLCELEDFAPPPVDTPAYPAGFGQIFKDFLAKNGKNGGPGNGGEGS